jgi:hypothetical protein
VRKKVIFLVIFITFLSLFSVCLLSCKRGTPSIHAGLRGGVSSNVLPSREELEMENTAFILNSFICFEIVLGRDVLCECYLFS